MRTLPYLTLLVSCALGCTTKAQKPDATQTLTYWNDLQTTIDEEKARQHKLPKGLDEKDLSKEVAARVNKRMEAMAERFRTLPTDRVDPELVAYVMKFSDAMKALVAAYRPGFEEADLVRNSKELDKVAAEAGYFQELMSGRYQVEFPALRFGAVPKAKP